MLEINKRTKNFVINPTAVGLWGVRGRREELSDCETKSR